MAKRYELSDEAWGVVSDLFLETHGRLAAATKRPRDARRRALGILLGCSVARYAGALRGWRNQGTFDQMLKRLHLRLNEQGLIDLKPG